MATAQLGGLTVNNPMQLSNTKVAPVDYSSNLGVDNGAIFYSPSSGGMNTIQNGQVVPLPPNTYQPAQNLGAAGAGSGYGSGAGGSATGSGTGTGTVPNPAMDAYMQASNTGIGDLQQQLGAIPTYEQQGADVINNSSAAQQQALNDQLSQGRTNLGSAQTQLDTQRAASLRDLGNQLRGMLNSYNTQLGVAGAGNSSAADLLGYALTQEGNSGRYDIQQQYGNQQQGINNQLTALKQNYDDQVGQLNAWKQQQLTNIAQQYGQQRSQLQEALANAGTDQVRTALYMQDAQAAQTALNHMMDVNNQVGTALSQLQTAYSQATGVPKGDLSAYQNYNVQQFNTNNLPGLTANSPSNAVSSSPVVASLYRNPNQTPSVGTLDQVTR